MTNTNMQKIEFDDEFVVESLGILEDDVYDIEVDDNHNFIANDICVHNSCYINMSDLVNKVYGDKIHNTPTQKIIEFMDRICEDKFQPYIDKSYKELAEYVRAYDQKMQMKREGLSNKGIWTAKKRYILNVYNNEGVQYKEPYIKVMGLEMVKSSTPSVIRTKMKDCIKLMLTGTESELHDFISNFKLEFFNLEPEDISFPRGVNGLEKYKHDMTIYKSATPIHVKGSLLYNLYLEQFNLHKKYPKIQEGDKIKYTYLKMPNPIKDIVISYPGRLPKEFGLHDYVDYNTQFQKTFVDPIKMILDCIGWKTEKVSTLDDFFS